RWKRCVPGWAERLGPAGRIVAARPRLVLGIVCGGLAEWALAGRLGPVTRAVTAWDAGVLVYGLAAAQLFLTEPMSALPAHAARDQEGEWTIFAITLAAASFSLIAVLEVFAGMHGASRAGRNLRLGLVAATLFLSWLMVHVTFTFRYAHEFYDSERAPPAFDRGLEFPGDDAPDYMDFLYFSLVLGMTFQVSDVQITGRNLRRLALLHGLLSFLFNTVILALTVNIAAGLV
ncbi:MAG: DUF1345 domain-containing protein, partial [Acetobacteraceae bacterium]